jgi:hypothetical protein
MDIGTGEPLPGEGSDRKFTFEGRGWRVRVCVNSEEPVNAPARDGAALTASKVGISVSVAALAEDDSVAVDEQGRFLVFDPHVLTIQGEALANPQFDPAAEILTMIEEQLQIAAVKLASKEKLAAAISQWTS